MCKSSKTCTKKMVKAEDNVNRLWTIDYKPGRHLVNVLEKGRHDFHFRRIKTSFRPKLKRLYDVLRCLYVDWEITLFNYLSSSKLLSSYQHE